MSNFESIATYQLTIGEQHQVIQTNGEPFDSQAYSRMKHGVISDTRVFADKLAATLCEEASDVVYGEGAPSLVVAYESLPHAASEVARFCLDSINKERAHVGRAPGDTLRIHTTDYMEPYSHRPLAEREQILSGQTGVLEAKDLRERHPVIIDDIRVTGSQERWFHDILASRTDGPISAAYIASFPDGRQYPELEGGLDDASITTLHDLLPYIDDGDVTVTHKFARDLLLSPPDELSYFLDRLPAGIVTAVRRGIRGMASSTLQPYQANCTAILARGTPSDNPRGNRMRTT